MVVGQQILLKNDKLPYKVMAVSKRYAVVSRKLNKKQDDNLLAEEVKMGAFSTKQKAFEECKHLPVYSILDFERGVMGTDNLVFGVFDYFKESDCQKAIELLESGEIDLSRRTEVELEYTEQISSK